MTKSFSEFLHLPDTVMFLEVCLITALGLTISWIIHPDGWGQVGGFADTANGIISTPGDPFLLWRIVVWIITILIAVLRFSYYAWKSES